MLDAIEERMKQKYHGGYPAHENAGRTRFHDLVTHGWESQEDTGVDFDIALVPDKNLPWSTEELQSSATVATNERTPIVALTVHSYFE